MLEAPAIAALTIFVLSLFVGVEVIAKVPPLLHTPLMSGSNAISGISVIGAILATGSELQLAIEAAQQLASRQRIRVVSMPCWEAFAAQERSYRDSVLPPSVGRERRMAIEAGTTLGWDRYADILVGIDHFGASAPAEVLAEKFGFTVDAVVERWNNRNN